MFVLPEFFELPYTTNVKGIKSTNKNVVSMDTTIVFNQSLTLNVSELYTSNVTNMHRMFDSILETTGYAKTQADANKFNASSEKPAELTFVVK